MAELSQNELKAIRSHPLKKGLKHFRATFKSRHLKTADANVTEVVDRLTSEASDGGEVGHSKFPQCSLRCLEARDVIVDLLLALQGQPAAQTILSRARNGPLVADISSNIVQVTSDEMNIK